MHPAQTVKMYYRIGEVARLLDVKPHVIRFWETEFRSLRPQKSQTGQRVFSREDVKLLRAIRELLYERGYTIEGARRHLRTKGIEPDQARDAIVARAGALRNGLQSVRARLVATLAAIDATCGPSTAPAGV